MSTNAHITVSLPKAVNIGYLRSLLDTNAWQAVDTTTLYAVSNAIVTSYTNTSGVGGYYIQDSSGGINLFVSQDTSFIPNMGDIVNVIGVLSSFNNNLELACFVTTSSASFSPYAYAAVVGNTNVLPAPIVFAPYSLTNMAGFMETNLEGRLVMITNVYFTNAPGSLTAGLGTASTVTTTNARGEPILVFWPSNQDRDVTNRPIPRFAWSVSGIMSQFKSGTYSAAGYEVTVTRWGDILTNPPPPVTATITQNGANALLNWLAVPYVTNYDMPGAYSYSVLTSPFVEGPYAPLVNGLAFNTTNGMYTDTGLNTYVAYLYGTNEVPSNASTATGLGSVILSPDQSTIYVNLQFSGLTTNATAAHIHGPAGAGTNTGVLFPFAGVPAATSGSIPQQSFAITPAQVGYLQSGLLYMNVHNIPFPGGEIRGQLYPATTRFYKIVSP
jgi:hypothetical protein